MRISNPDCSPVGINRWHTATTPTGFAEIVSDDLRESEGMVSVLTFDTAWSRLAKANDSPFQLKRHGRQRRQVNEDGVLAAHPGNVLGLNAAQISHVAAAVRLSIGVDELTIET
jgi:hypothetical protein